jgi:Fe2+ or Zn2+ uptake regulation protein
MNKAKEMVSHSSKNMSDVESFFKQALLVWLELWDGGRSIQGLTSAEVAKALGLRRYSVDRSLKALQEANLVRKVEHKNVTLKHVNSDHKNVKATSEGGQDQHKNETRTATKYRIKNRNKLRDLFLNKEEIDTLRADKKGKIHKGTYGLYKNKNKEYIYNKSINNNKASLTNQVGNNASKSLPSRSDSAGPSGALKKNKPLPSRSDSLSSSKNQNTPSASPTDPLDVKSWWTPAYQRRLERRRYNSVEATAKAMAKTIMVEQDCLNQMWAGYYREHSTDAFTRTLEFCYAYRRTWGAYSNIPIVGNRCILGKNYTDSDHWHSLVDARRQADRHNAKYDEWCKAIFEHYDENPLPGNALVTPKFFKTAKAAEIYTGWHLNRYANANRDLERPVWTAEEYDPKCTVQAVYWQGLVKDVSRIAKYSNSIPFEVLAGYVSRGVIPIQAVEAYAPELLELVKKKLARIKVHSFDL